MLNENHHTLRWDLVRTSNTEDLGARIDHVYGGSPGKSANDRSESKR